MEGEPRGGWKRNHEAEKRVGQFGVRGPGVWCFSSPPVPDRPAAALWLHARGPGELYVSHITPLHRHELSDEEHNRLLAEFQRDCLEPAARGCGVRTEVVASTPSFEQQLSPEAARRLRAFSAAFREGLQAQDRHLWNAFLIQVHRDESLIESELLDGWLEHEGWPGEQRRRLVDEFSWAQSLLLAYDEELQPRSLCP